MRQISVRGFLVYTLVASLACWGYWHLWPAWERYRAQLALIESLESHVEEDIAASLEAVERLDAQRDALAMVSALLNEEPNAHTQVYAVLAIGALKVDDELSVSQLIRASNSKNPAVKRAAACGMAHFVDASPEARIALERMYQDASPAVGLTAAGSFSDGCADVGVAPSWIWSELGERRSGSMRSVTFPGGASAAERFTRDIARYREF